MAWPNVLGTCRFGRTTYWGDLDQDAGSTADGVGADLLPGGTDPGAGVGAALAISAWGQPGVDLLARTVIGSLGMLGSLGWYTSPIWMARALAVTTSSPAIRDGLPDLGPLDPIDPNAVRRDGYLRDSDGSVYWGLATVLPGFRQFRYPAKLFTLCALAMAALAGLGWDRVVAGRGRGAAAVFSGLLVLTLCTLAVVVVQREPILAAIRGLKAPSHFGPLDAVAAYQAIIRGLAQSAIVFGLGLFLTISARKNPALAGSMALILTTADLAAANSRYILTVPQSVFETKPEAARAIEDAERADHSRGPFRIHRVRGWHPRSWDESTSPDRLLEVARWERDTLNPKHGIDYGLEYTYSIGVGELADYEPFFTTFYLRVPDDRAAAELGVAVGEPVVYFPRRAYDLWNTRYIIVPFGCRGLA